MSRSPIRMLRFKLCAIVYYFTFISAATESEKACASDWHKYGLKCYRLFSHHVTFREAEESCILMGRDVLGTTKSSLLSIHSQIEQDFITTIFGLKPESYWIGLKLNEKKFKWTNGSPLNYTNWMFGQPDNYEEKEDCTEMRISHQADDVMWNDVPCNLKKGFVCQAPVGYNRFVEPKCNETGFIKYRNSCYKLHTEPADYKTAEETCQNYGGHLISEVDTYERAFANIMRVEINGNVWIGLSDTNETYGGYFHWTDDWPVYYTNFANGQPNESNVFERCVVKNSENFWSVQDCNTELPYICKISYVKTPENSLVIGSCPLNDHLNWIDVGTNVCYYFEDKMFQTWDEAKQMCKSFDKHSNLASFHSQHEVDLLKIHLTKSLNHLWIGLTKNLLLAERWVDRTPVDFLNWKEGEPNNVNERCLEILNHNIKWNDAPCSKKNGYLCAVRKTTTIPKRTTKYRTTLKTTVLPKNSPIFTYPTLPENARNSVQEGLLSSRDTKDSIESHSMSTGAIVAVSFLTIFALSILTVVAFIYALRRFKQNSAPTVSTGQTYQELLVSA